MSKLEKVIEMKNIAAKTIELLPPPVKYEDGFTVKGYNCTMGNCDRPGVYKLNNYGHHVGNMCLSHARRLADRYGIKLP